MTRREVRAGIGSGILATFVATIAGYWFPGFGLPRLDFATLHGNLLVPEAASASFAWSMGLLEQFGLGVLCALIYVGYVADHLPGEGWIRGMIWGAALCVLTGAVVVPLLFGGGAFGTGWEGATPLALVIWFLVWGCTLGIAHQRPHS